MLHARHVVGSRVMIFLGLVLTAWGTTSALAGRTKTVNPYAGSWFWEEDTGDIGWVQIDDRGQIVGELYGEFGVQRATGDINSGGGFSLKFTPYRENGTLDKKASSLRSGWASFDEFGNVQGGYYSWTGFPYGFFVWTPQ